ncbi:hypothetical protein [Thermococcus sp.]|uniref:hypothetical protein n=1 Tax=Thermococcus sp. TaxID=35749 RepID=UPI0025E0CB64|nr:hypothetical protein [Thermococcus sp.]
MLPVRYWNGWEVRTKDGKTFRFKALAGVKSGGDLVVLIMRDLGYCIEDIEEVTMYLGVSRKKRQPVVFPDDDAIFLGAFIPKKDADGEVIGYEKIEGDE